MQEKRKDFRDAKHKEKLEELRMQNEGSQAMYRSDAYGPSLMK